MARKKNTWTAEEERSLYRMKAIGRKSWKEISTFLRKPVDEVKAKWSDNDWSDVMTAVMEPEETVEKVDLRTDEEVLDDEIYRTKASLTRKNELKIYNDMLRKRANAELVADKLTSAVQALPPLDLKRIEIPNIVISKTEEVATLCIGDVHCGLVVREDETSGMGNYNMLEFQRRLDCLVESATKITKLHRNMYPINKAAIFLLGDLVQGGRGVGAWSPAYIEQGIVTQIFVCIEALEVAIAQLIQQFEEIDIYCVPGNHGRIAGKGLEEDYGNWDFIAYKFLEKAFQNQPRVRFHFDKSWLQVAEIQNHKFLLVHGENISSWGGIPFYGIQRAEGKYRSLLEQTKTGREAHAICRPFLDKLESNPKDEHAIAGLINSLMLYCKSFDYMVMGHFHIPATLTSNSGGKTLVNGSFFGGDNFSLKQLQSACPPTQKFFGVHPEHGITWQYDLNLGVK